MKDLNEWTTWQISRVNNVRAHPSMNTKVLLSQRERFFSIIFWGPSLILPTDQRRIVKKLQGPLKILSELSILVLFGFNATNMIRYD